jgi:hypothetical protein
MPWSACFVLVARSIPDVKLTAVTVTVPGFWTVVHICRSSECFTWSHYNAVQCIIAVALNISGSVYPSWWQIVQPTARNIFLIKYCFEERGVSATTRDRREFYCFYYKWFLQRYTTMRCAHSSLGSLPRKPGRMGSPLPPAKNRENPRKNSGFGKNLRKCYSLSYCQQCATAGGTDETSWFLRFGWNKSLQTLPSNHSL